MPNHALNDIGLVQECRSLIQMQQRNSTLQERVVAAQKELDANVKAIESCRSRLGAHTREVRHSAVVVFKENDRTIAAIIPQPAVGYEETDVDVQFRPAHGIDLL